MRKVLASLLVAAASAFCAVPASAEIIVKFTPSTQHAAIGDTVKVDVSIEGLGDEVLSAFDLNFLWNGLIMGSTRSVGYGNAFNQLGGSFGTDPLFLVDTTTLGNWGLQANALVDDATLIANQANSFLLFSFAFTADKDGSTIFGLGLDPDFERAFVGLRAQALDVTIGSACVAVGTAECSASVPEPSTLSLLALALAGATMIGVRRRRTI